MELRQIVLLCYFGLQFVNCQIPSYIKVCPQTHPNLTACVIDSVENLREKLKTGIEELDVPSIEPFKLDDVRIEPFGDGTRLVTNLTDVEVYGASQFQILKLVNTLTKNGYTFRFNVNIPQARVMANYELDARILFLDLKGKGPFIANFTNFLFECIMKGNKVKIDNKNYLEFKDVKLNVIIGDASILLGELFDGNPVLSKATNEVINDNAQLLFDAIKPNVVAALSRVFTDIANKITKRFEYEDLFP